MVGLLVKMRNASPTPSNSAHWCNCALGSSLVTKGTCASRGIAGSRGTECGMRKDVVRAFRIEQREPRHSEFRNGRPGFVHALEAMMATFLVIGFVLFIIPVLREPADLGQTEKARLSERIKVLDYSGELETYLGTGGSVNLSGLLDKIASDTALSYQYSVSWESFASETASGNKSIDMAQGQNNISEVVVSAWNATALLLPETVVWDSGGPKSVAATGGVVNVTSARIDASHAQVNFTSMGEYRYRVRTTETYGSLPQNRSVRVSSYVLPGGILQVLYSNQ